jgi:hypothetical protein
MGLHGLLQGQLWLFARKLYGGREIQLQAFLTSALDRGEWSASRLSRFAPWENYPGICCRGGWVRPGVVLDIVKTEITDCFKKSFTVLFQMLMCSECYDNVYI